MCRHPRQELKLQRNREAVAGCLPRLVRFSSLLLVAVCAYRGFLLPITTTAVCSSSTIGSAFPPASMPIAFSPACISPPCGAGLSLFLMSSQHPTMEPPNCILVWIIGCTSYPAALIIADTCTEYSQHSWSLAIVQIWTLPRWTPFTDSMNFSRCSAVIVLWADADLASAASRFAAIASSLALVASARSPESILDLSSDFSFSTTFLTASNRNLRTTVEQVKSAAKNPTQFNAFDKPSTV